MADAPAKAAGQKAADAPTPSTSNPVASETTSGTASVAGVKAPQASGRIIRRVPPGSRRANRMREKRRTGPFIKYVGEASTRKISSSDWATLGVKGKREKDDNGNALPAGDFEWNFSNDRMIEADVFSEDQLDYLLIDDLQPNGTHSFLEVDYNEKGELDQVIYEESEDAE